MMSCLKIVFYYINTSRTKKQIEKIDNMVEIEEVIHDTENIEIVKPNITLPRTDPYWDYIKMNLINVDFEKLKSVNNDVKGWIQVNGTNINYPFVQTIDNKYYLTHSFDNSYNYSGWVFLDYRNNNSSVISNKNTIIYAHGLKNGTMFGTLKNALNKNWYNNTDNHIVKLSTEMVVGAEGDTLESIKETAKFVSKNHIAVPRFYILTPIPGTEYYDEMKKANRIYNTDMYSYNACEAVHIPKNMTPEELTKAYWELYNEVYSMKSIIKRTLLTRTFFKRPIDAIFYFGVNCFYRYQIKKGIVPNII